MVDTTAVVPLPETGEWQSVPRIENGWRPTGGAVNPETDSGIANWQAQVLAVRTKRLKDRQDNMALRAGGLVTVGVGGDYPTINAAISALSEMRPAYTLGGIQTEIRLKAGFAMAEQILVSGVNLGWLKITAEAAEVFIDRAYLTLAVEGSYPAFSAASGGVLPVISALFTMMATGPATQRDGLLVADGGSASVLSGAGIKSAGRSGIRAHRGGIVAANGAIFSGAGETGAYFAAGTRGALEGANLSGAGICGIDASNSATVHAALANASGAGTNGILATRAASVNAAGANARRGTSDSTADFAVSAGGVIVAALGTGGTSITPNTITASGIIYK